MNMVMGFLVCPKMRDTCNCNVAILIGTTIIKNGREWEWVPYVQRNPHHHNN
jgi:hypothetical protein